MPRPLKPRPVDGILPGGNESQQMVYTELL